VLGLWVFGLVQQALVACGKSETREASHVDGSGGTVGASGSSATGGSSKGGRAGDGGAGDGGAGDGGSATGGSATGGSATGGSATGGTRGTPCGVTLLQSATRASGEGGFAGGGGEAGAGSTGCFDAPSVRLNPCTVRRPWVDAGFQHTCFLRGDGRLSCWGNNRIEYSWQTWGSGHATPPTGVFSRLVTDFRSGALDADGNAVYWGDGDFSDAPDEPFKDLTLTGDAVGLDFDGNLKFPMYTQADPPSGTFVAVTGGAGFGCALAADGSAACWRAGNTEQTRCGPFVELSAGPAHVCALVSDGTVTCWGDDTDGRASPPSGTFTQVSSGSTHTCAVRSNGRLVCWGDPARTAAPTGSYVQVSAGASHSCALSADDEIVCWGNDDFFQLDPPPDLAVASETFTKVSVGGSASVRIEGDDYGYQARGCGLRADGTIECWGGLADVPSGSFVDVAVGPAAGCAIDAHGALSCWKIPEEQGSDRYEYGVSVPPDDLASDTFTSVSFASYYACGLRTNGEVACWDGPYDVALVPPAGPFTRVDVSGSQPPHYPGDPVEVHVCALRTNGDAHCWGYSPTGGAATERLVDGPFVEIAAGYYKDFARRSDGTVVGWMANATSPVEPVAGTFTTIDAGESFQGLRTDGSVDAGPTFPWENDTFSDIAVAGDFACGLRTDGHVRCWGDRVR
jgi:hypothetical protein